MLCKLFNKKHKYKIATDGGCAMVATLSNSIMIIAASCVIIAAEKSGKVERCRGLSQQQRHKPLVNERLSFGCCHRHRCRRCHRHRHHHRHHHRQTSQLFSSFSSLSSTRGSTLGWGCGWMFPAGQWGPVCQSDRGVIKDIKGIEGWSVIKGADSQWN